MYVFVGQGITVDVGLQPRYIYPLLLTMAGVALLSFDRDNLGLKRFQLVLIVVLLSVANAVESHTNIRRYVTGTKVRIVDLDVAVKWWSDIPVSPMAVWIIGSLSFTAFAVGAAVCAQRAARVAPESTMLTDLR